jgi:hypothetical protein
MTINGLHYSRFFMNQFIGKKTTDALHEFSQRLHSLNITQVEHSLIIPIILCLPDEQLIDSESVHIIKYCYMYALYIQLCTTRTEGEAKSVFDHILQVNRIKCMYLFYFYLCIDYRYNCYSQSVVPKKYWRTYT